MLRTSFSRRWHGLRATVVLMLSVVGMGATGGDLALADEATPIMETGTLVVTVTMGDGSPVPARGVDVCISAVNGTLSTCQHLADATTTFANLPPDSYYYTIKTSGFDEYSGDVTVYAGETSVLDATLAKSAAAGTAVFELSTVDGGSVPSNANACLHVPGGATYCGHVFETEVLVEHVPVGTYDYLVNPYGGIGAVPANLAQVGGAARGYASLSSRARLPFAAQTGYVYGSVAGTIEILAGEDSVVNVVLPLQSDLNATLTPQVTPTATEPVLDPGSPEAETSPTMAPTDGVATPPAPNPGTSPVARATTGPISSSVPAPAASPTVVPTGEAATRPVSGPGSTPIADVSRQQGPGGVSSLPNTGDGSTQRESGFELLLLVGAFTIALLAATVVAGRRRDGRRAD
ncbi:MAG TPA: hypothetical protein VFQ54_00920 [Thermomicrobiales bacterium]|nr:hypothetical protein [Thermomicrobiales bacterium]